MSDRASLSSSSEGAQSPSRRRNPTITTDDDPQYHFDSLQEKQVEVATAASAPHTTTRRRSSRTTSGTKSSPRSASPLPPQQQSYSEDVNEGSDRKSSKPPRKTLKKLLRRDSHHTEIVPGSLQSGHEDAEDDEGSTVGYIPRLGQIRERKTSMQSRRRGSSIVSSSGQPRALRRRHTDDSAVSRLRAQRKHSSSSKHRHGGKLAELSEPSSASSVSQQSSASSSGSNSTVTQKSREDQDYTYQYETFGERQRLALQNSMMNADAQSEVFKYLQTGNDDDSSAFTGSSQATSSTSLPLSFPDHSVATGSHITNGSNVTLQASSSPTLTQPPSAPAPHLPHQEFRKFKKPLYASSFVHGPADDDDETVNQSAESEQGSDTEGEQQAKGSSESSPKVETKAPPPRPQSTSSRGSDPHVRRLKQQERELANHILKNPRPQKKFQFAAPGTPAQPYPPVPMYSPQAYPTSPSVVSGAPATNPAPQGWPPMHTFPAPLAIGYAPHQSPEASPAYPHSMVAQMPPPFSPHGSQPPHYQKHAPAPSQTKYPMTGYELLANQLSAPSPDEAPRATEIVPVYRKFEHLNHRVLLHLQDEMCELEEELRQLDRCIAQMSPKDPSGHAYPASRRNDARYGGDLHFKRTELLGRIFQKLEQYNKALSSFSEVSRNLVAARAEDIASYREWMDEHEPIDYAESQFLERGQDLVAIRRGGAMNTAKEGGGSGQQHHLSAAVWFPLILVVPLMAFAIVPSLLGRLVVIVLIVGVELKLVASAPELKGFLSSQEWTAAVSVYFGLNVLLAAVVG